MGRVFCVCAVLLAACGVEDAATGPDVGVVRCALTRHVPGEYPTIRDAWRRARRGDVIQIAAGEYHERHLYGSSGVTVRGAGMGRTIIHGAFELDENSGYVIQDLTLLGDGGRAGVEGWGTYTVERCEIRGFHMGIDASGTRGTPTLRDNLIAGNVYGIRHEDATSHDYNNVLLNNSKAGIFAQLRCNVDIHHNTVVGNGFGGTLDGLGGGIAIGPESNSPAKNNVVVGNRFGLNCQGCAGAIHHNDVWGNVEDYAGDAAPGEGDLALDPQLVDPAAGDFRLRAGSPCIDAGVDAGVDHDALGAVRPFGATPDLGAYEWARAFPGLVLNEVMANPLDEWRGEYLEIANTSGAPVDAAGLSVDDGDSRDALVGWQDGPTEIPADGFAVVLDPDYVEGYDLPQGTVLLTVEDSALGNGLSLGDPITLLAGATVVSTYAHPFDPGNGVSAERSAPEAEDGPAAWAASPCGASPGADNCTLAPPAGGEGLRISEVMANPLDEATGEFVELLNLGPRAVDLAGAVLSDGDRDDLLEPRQAGGGAVLEAGAYAVVLDRDYADQYGIPAGTLLLTVGDRRLGNSLSTNDPVTVRDAAGDLLAAFSHPFDPGNGRSAELADPALGDVAGNWVATPCEAPPFATPGAPGCAGGGGGDPATLDITEVMANPLSEDTGEYVELHNRGDAPMPAAGLVLDDGDASDVLRPFGGGDGVVPAGGYALVIDPEHAGDFAWPADTVLLVPDDTTLGSGLAVSDPITLRAADGVTLVSTFHHPFNPGNGVSVERVDDRGDVEGNWVASPCPSGGSPGRANCASGGDPPDPADVPGVVINEVLANAAVERTGELVELLNAGDEPVDLAGFRLFDGDALDPLQAWGEGPTTVQPGGYAVVLDRDYAGEYDIPGEAVLLTVDDAAIASGLAVADPITLLMPDGVTVVDTFSHPFDPGDGRSVERTAPDAPDVPGSWVACPCPAPVTATPGAENCAGT